ncbi:MAG: tandem-95 repeat protein [Cyclobacteriaceae bacterium]|nr:tandem-95 repeat protein [Cyclobacteriaceae bacterium]
MNFIETLSKHRFSIKLNLLVFTPLIFLTTIAYSQNQTPRVTTASTIHFYEYLPPDYNSNTNNYPVVFFMHGLGERGNTAADLPLVHKHGPPKFVKNNTQFPFILISPQLKTNFGDWPPWYIDEVVEYCRTYLRIDPKRMYFTGMSLGGGGAWYYAQTYPNKVAALAPVCGSRNLTSKACDLVNSNIPVWAFHGSNDTTVPQSRTINMINAMNACNPAPNPAPILTIYPGVGHNAWDKAYRPDHVEHNPNVYEWMMMQVNGGVTVNAGPDITLNLPTNSTTITGTASTQTGTITSYAWTKLSGPAVTLANTNTPTVSLTNMVEGVYTFRLTATSSSGDSSHDDVKVTVLQINQPPVANAGPDITITLPTSSVTINGIGSDPDGSITTYAWVKNSGPSATISGQNTATLNLTNLVEGVYVFTLTVTDNLGATGTDQVTITVNAAAVNQPPVANAGPDITVNLPTSSVNITGSGSDPDGTIASYLWEKISGPSVTIANANTPTVSLTALVAGTYVFRLTVTDNQGATAFDEVTINVVTANQSPSANAGPDVTITSPTSSITITGSGTDPDGSITTYAWIQVSGPSTAVLTNANTSNLTASSLIAGIYRFRLTVTDNLGATGSDDMLVTVNAAPVNNPPVANAGPDITITLPTNTVIINGSGTDSDGTVVAYQWSKLSGPASVQSGQTTPSLTVNNMVAGTYTFRLTVTDNQGATGTDNVSVIVQPEVVNQAPIVNAGPDVSLTLPSNSTLLQATASDPDGSIASYQWQQISGPSFSGTGNTTANFSLNDLQEGSYVFRITVTDNLGATATDEVGVFVFAANQPPVVNASSDQTITLPTSTVILTAVASDPDGTIDSYLWIYVSGPGSPTLSGATTTSLTAGNLIQGTYTFRITVTDNDGATAFDEVNVVVQSATNQSPIANAGPNKSITLPTNSTNFTGSGVDPDGTIISYAWVQISGTAATLSNANTATLTVQVPADGTYTFRLTVTDNDGASGSSNVTLTVNPAAVNQPPVVSAGPNQSITLPQNSLNLNGTASDPDGSIASYLWIKFSGPTATLTNAITPTLSVADMVEGTYIFRLTVTDNGGLTASANVTVNVLPAAVNQPPVANAGPDRVLTLPTNNTTLLGSGTDADGTIVSYEWIQLTGPAATLLNATTPTLTIQDLVAGVYDFSLTVTDDQGATGTDVARVTVNALPVNQPPVANAGPDRTINLPTNIATLNGSGSDSDGSIVRYLWTKVSGPTVIMGNVNIPNLSLSELVEGTYRFRLEVEDNDGAIATDDAMVFVIAAAVNQPPVVSSGGNKSIFLPTNSTTLNGSASDPDGSITAVVWTQVTGPSTATLTNSNTVNLMVSNLIEGIYRFRLTATDNAGATASADAQVTVNAATVNQPPTANAGPDVTIQLPVNNTNLNGSGNDPDGTIASYAWSKLSGPVVTLTNANTATLLLSGMAEGVYSFRLTVTDNEGATASDIANVTVLPASINNPPVVNAGPDRTIVLPVNSTTLTGTATDDGTITAVQWTKVSGPDAVLTGANSLSVAISNLVEGTYVFRLTATDNGGLTASDDAQVNVEPALITNPPPTVDAGETVTIALPVDSVAVTAVATSPGLIETYKWTQLNGSPVQINPDTTDVLRVKNLTEGEYLFRITVTDGDNQSATDDLLVIVERPAVKPANVFSPNNDNFYDTWTIDHAELLSGCTIEVTDRQGKRVYNSTGYETAWDGVFNGQPLPMGAYFYTIRCNNQKPLTGSVTIIR